MSNRRIPGNADLSTRGPSRGGGVCVVPGDPQSVDVTVSVLPAKTSAGTPASSLFGGGRSAAGFLVPMGVYAGMNWSRSGRATTGTGSDAPSIPAIPGVPITMAPGREVYLRRSGQVTAAGVCELIFYPVARVEDLDNPFFMAAIAQAVGGGGGSIGLPFPPASLINDNDPNPTTTRVGANLMLWDGSTWDRALVAADNADAVIVQGTGANRSATRPFGFNGTSWDRLRSAGDDSDAVAVATLGQSLILGRSTGFNGTTWDRLRTVGSGAATGRGRLRIQDAWSTINGSQPALDTNALATTTLYTCSGLAKVYVSLVQTAFTGAATLQVSVNGSIVAQYVTAAVGNIALNLGPYYLANTNTIDIIVTAAGVGTVSATAVGEERAAL